MNVEPVSQSAAEEGVGQPDNDKVVDMLKGRRFTEDQLADIERIVSSVRDAMRMEGDHND